MRYCPISITCITWLLPLLLSLTPAQETVQEALWVVPDGKLPDLSQTFTAGTTLALSWNAYTTPSYIDASKTLVDLWVTAFDGNANSFNQLLTESINLTSAGNYAWTIAIPNGNLTFDAKYVLRFKATASTYDPNTADLSSPGFLVLREAASSSSTSTSSTGPTSSPSLTTPVTSTFSQSSSPTAPANSACTSCGLSTGAKAGIGIGVVIAVLALAGVAYFTFILKRKSKTSAATATNEMANKGVEGERIYEISRAPVELPCIGNEAELPVRY